MPVLVNKRYIAAFFTQLAVLRIVAEIVLDITVSVLKCPMKCSFLSLANETSNPLGFLYLLKDSNNKQKWTQ
jgi:hypothetical protein